MEEPFAKTALWSKRLGLFAVPVCLLAILAQRSGKLEFLPAATALGSGFVLAASAILLGVLSFAVIWVRGNRGAGAAALGVLMGLGVLATPIYFLASAWDLPPITDIATDPASPPGFALAAAERRHGDHPAAYPGEQAALVQMSAFPDIEPLRLSQPPDEARELALQLVEQRGWRVLDNGAESNRIEAVATSMVLKLVDDVVIQIRPQGSGARVDMRSAARSGKHDFGRNAERVRAFLAELAANAR